MTEQTTNNVTNLHPEQPVTRDAVTNWNGTEATAYMVEPYEGDVGNEIGDEVEDLIKTFMHFTDRDSTLMTLWPFHANKFKWFRFTPRLGFTAGTESCGKSQGLAVCSYLTNHSYFLADITPASFFTLTEAGDNALFVDELPDLLGGGDKSNVLTSLKTGVNHMGRATRLEMHNGGRRAMQFSTHAPVAFSGVGVDGMVNRQVYSRTLWIHMQQAYSHEQPESFYLPEHEPMFREKTSKILKWMNDHEEQIRGFNRNSMPSYIQNRDRDKWEPFFAIASVLGDKWLERVHRISLEVKQDDVLTQETTLLKAIQDIYCNWNEYSRGAELDTKVTPAELCHLLRMWEDEDGWRSYANYNKAYEEEEKRIKSKQLTKSLRSFKLVTEGHRSSLDGGRERGYLWKDLLETADRHLPEHFRVNQDESCHTVTCDKVVRLPNEYVPGEDREEVANEISF